MRASRLDGNGRIILGDTVSSDVEEAMQEAARRHTDPEARLREQQRLRLEHQKKVATESARQARAIGSALLRSHQARPLCPVMSRIRRARSFLRALFMR